jgi:hypothetical protein
MLDVHMVVKLSTLFSCNLVVEEPPRFFDCIVKVMSLDDNGPNQGYHITTYYTELSSVRPGLQQVAFMKPKVLLAFLLFYS